MWNKQEDFFVNRKIRLTFVHKMKNILRIHHNELKKGI